MAENGLPSPVVPPMEIMGGSGGVPESAMPPSSEISLGIPSEAEKTAALAAQLEALSDPSKVFDTVNNLDMVPPDTEFSIDNSQEMVDGSQAFVEEKPDEISAQQPNDEKKVDTTEEVQIEQPSESPSEVRPDEVPAENENLTPETSSNNNSSASSSEQNTTQNKESQNEKSDNDVKIPTNETKEDETVKPEAQAEKRPNTQTSTAEQLSEKYQGMTAEEAKKFEEFKNNPDLVAQNPDEYNALVEKNSQGQELTRIKDKIKNGESLTEDEKRKLREGFNEANKEQSVTPEAEPQPEKTTQEKLSDLEDEQTRLEAELQEGKNVEENQKRINEIKKERQSLVEQEYKEKYKKESEMVAPEKTLTRYEKRILDLQLKMMRLRQQARRLPESLDAAKKAVAEAKAEALKKKAEVDTFGNNITSSEYEEATREHSKATSELMYAAKEQATTELGMVSIQRQHAEARREYERMTGQIGAVEKLFKDTFSFAGKELQREAISKRAEEIAKRGTFFRVTA